MERGVVVEYTQGLPSLVWGSTRAGNYLNSRTQYGRSEKLCVELHWWCGRVVWLYAWFMVRCRWSKECGAEKLF